MKRFLKLEVIWKDQDMFELQVSCSNGRFSGTTEIYDSQLALLPFAKSLKGFPNGKAELLYSSGKEDRASFFQMRFYQIGLSGIVGVEIRLEENTYTNNYRLEEKHKVGLELIVEPNSINIFQKELIRLAIEEDGVAELIGIEKFLNNIH